MTGGLHYTCNDPEGCPNEMTAERGDGLEEQHSQERKGQTQAVKQSGGEAEWAGKGR